MGAAAGYSGFRRSFSSSSRRISEALSFMSRRDCSSAMRMDSFLMAMALRERLDPDERIPGASAA